MEVFVEQVVLKLSDLHLLKAQKATERRHQAKHMCGAKYRSLIYKIYFFIELKFNDLTSRKI